MAHSTSGMWVTDNTLMRAIPQRIRDESLMIKRYANKACILPDTNRKYTQDGWRSIRTTGIGNLLIQPHYQSLLLKTFICQMEIRWKSKLTNLTKKKCRACVTCRHFFIYIIKSYAKYIVNDKKRKNKKNKNKNT